MAGLVFGVGVNDVSPISDGGVHIPAYAAWKNMLKRCYDFNWQEANKTYKGCTVCREWMTFSAFKLWFDKNYIDGWQIDKDLLVTENKIYSPYTCVFVPKWLNTFTTAHTSARGDFPIGVFYHKKKMRYIAQISDGSVRVHLGGFSTPAAAHLAWHNAKLDIAHRYKEMCDMIDPRLFEGVIRKINSMREV
jgi:hypothetical protein